MHSTPLPIMSMHSSFPLSATCRLAHDKKGPNALIDYAPHSSDLPTGSWRKWQHPRVHWWKLLIWCLWISSKGHPGEAKKTNLKYFILFFQVGKITASDADKNENADITYSLLTEWGNEVFSLNPSSGIFTLTSGLDYEKTEHYMFVVSGTDHGEPQLSSTVTVYINVKDINDNVPSFTQGIYKA